AVTETVRGAPTAESALRRRAHGGSAPIEPAPGSPWVGGICCACPCDLSPSMPAAPSCADAPRIELLAAQFAPSATGRPAHHAPQEGAFPLSRNVKRGAR